MKAERHAALPRHGAGEKSIEPVETNLSDSQKTCLRLVANGMSSKEIAKDTGLTPSTVDTYIKTAIARLGASNRRQAARILLSAEVSQQSGSPSLPVVEPADPADDRIQIGQEGWRKLLRFPPIGGGLNELSWSEKTYQALRVAATGTIVVIALALTIAGLLHTVQ